MKMYSALGMFNRSLGIELAHCNLARLAGALERSVFANGRQKKELRRFSMMT